LSKHATSTASPGGADMRYRALGRKDIDSIPQLAAMPPEERDVMRAVSAVLPFRVNSYVLDHLIDWKNIPEDPIYQLTFPQRGMLEQEDLDVMLSLVRRKASQEEIAAHAREIQHRMNPHPAGQKQLNVPSLAGKRLPGMQHKYRETVLFFPSSGQTCHAYCTYCFRWPQFVGLNELKFASNEADTLVAYLKQHKEVSSVLLTGGDPLIMRTEVIRRYVEPLLGPGLEHITNIRLGTKSPAYWPYRFVTDPDADDLLRLFESVRKKGKHLALMAHFSHPRELETRIAQTALRRILETGAVIRCQAPVVRHVNDDGALWADMWRLQARLGAVPYYMFVERDTGPKDYFDVPLVRAWEIFSHAYRHVSGLARTVRGPSMSATPGKVKICGVSAVHGEKVFVLTFEQARDPYWVGRPFFAKFDARATWLDQLKPAFGEREFFFASGMRAIERAGGGRAWGTLVPGRRKPVLFGESVRSADAA